MATQKTVKLSDYYVRKNELATQLSNGLMSSTDKTKLNNFQITNDSNGLEVGSGGYMIYQYDRNGDSEQIGQYITHVYGSTIEIDNIIIPLSFLEEIQAGKKLSDVVYTQAEKTKLAGIEAGATNIVVDSSITSNSTNPVESQAIYNALHSLQISDISGLSNALSTAISYYVITQLDAETIFGTTEITDETFSTGIQTYITNNPSASETLYKANTILLLPNTATPTFYYEYICPEPNKFELLGTNKNINLAPYMLTSDFDDFYNDEYSVDLPLKADKTGGVAQVTDTQASTYTNIGTLSNNATQQSINNAINTALTGNVKDSNLVDKLDGIVQQLIQLGE